MKFIGLLSILFFVTGTSLGQWSTSSPSGQQAFPTVIPNQLSLCYFNATLNARFNRMPNSIENLVALIRKVEAHPDAALWSPGKMAVTLIHRFRYDGVIDISTGSPDVVPVTNERSESDKFRMQWRLLPGEAADFPESSLTAEEKCSLHWMLSYTVNRTQRAEERMGARQLATSSLEGDGDDHSNHDDGEHHDHDAAEVDQPAEEDELDEKNVDEEPAPQENEINEDEGNEENKEEEEQTDEQPEEKTEEEEEQNSEHDSDNDHQANDEDYGNDESPKEDDDFSFFRRKRQSTIPQSNYPLEGGVVRSQYGTVAAGVVLAGIAAGNNPQSVLLKEFIRDPSNPLSNEALERSLENSWAVTLAGDIAQTSLLNVPKRLPITGPRGEWNNTFCPREYRLASKDTSRLTNAEIYGGIDGLLMSRRVKTWDSSSFLKLSAILEQYYSENGIYGDQTYRACNRIKNYKNPIIVDPAMLKSQALNAALVLYARGIDGAPIINPTVRPTDEIGRYINSTISELNQRLNDNNNVEIDFKQCEGAPAVPTTETPATYSDLTFVIDQFNDGSDIEKQKQLVAALANVMDVQLGGSRIEVVSSKDGTPFFTVNATTNKAELACMATSLPVPYSERRIATTLQKTRERILTERSGEKAYKIGGGNTRAIIFFVSSYTSNTAEKDKIKDQTELMAKQMPDVHLMFATLASPEDFRPFVKDFDKDIIRMLNYVTYSDAAPDISKRLTTIGARLSYPVCGDLKKLSESQITSTEASFVYSGFLNPGTVQYFRIGPEHFFSSDMITLRFKSVYGVARYCWAKGKMNPGPGDSCTSAITASETVEFKINSPCNKVGTADSCQPIYVSAAPVGIDDNIACSEKDCHTPDQVKFTFTHEGMRCDGVSSAQISITSNLILILAALLSWLFYHNH